MSAMHGSSYTFPSATDGAGYVPSAQPVLAWSASQDLFDGDNGIAQTIRLVREVVWKSLSDPWMRMQAATLLRASPSVPPYDEPAKAYRFWDKVYSQIAFVDHPIAHQLVQAPEFTVAARIGNCTDINAVLLASLLMNVGIETHLVTIANDPNYPDEFNHVIAEAKLDGVWVPIDAARPGASFGTTVPNIYRSRVWDLLSSDYFERRGLNGQFMGYQTTDPYQNDYVAPGSVLDPNYNPGDTPYPSIGPVEGPPWPGYSGPVGGGFSLSSLANILNAISRGVSTGVQVFGAGGPIVTPRGTAPAAPAGTIAGIPTSMLLLGGLGLGALLLLKKR